MKPYPAADKRTRFLVLLLGLVLIAYGAVTTVRANRLQRRLTRLEAAHQQLRIDHNRLKMMSQRASLPKETAAPKSQDFRGVLTDQQFREILGALEKEQGFDLPVPAGDFGKVNAPRFVKP